MKAVLTDFFKNEDIKRDVKEIIKPVVAFVYDEIYIYLWFICIYNVFLLVLIIAVLYWVLRLPTKLRTLGDNISL